MGRRPRRWSSLLLPRGTGCRQRRGAERGRCFILVFATTGALVASRIPGNPIGWLLCSAALAFAIGGVCVGHLRPGRQGRLDGPAVTAAAWVGTFVWMLGVGPAATFVLLLFPDGRLPSRRWRPVAWLAGASLAAIDRRRSPSARDRSRTPRCRNPLGLAGAKAALETVETAGLALLLLGILASCASLVVALPARRA